MNTNPSKPGFSPGKPAVYTPHSGQPGIAEAVEAGVDELEAAKPDTRPGAPARPDVPDRSHPPLPVDLTTGERVDQSDEDTKPMPIDFAKRMGTGEGGRPAKKPGEDRRDKS